MLRQSQPEDYVIATGIQHSVPEFVEFAANELGISIERVGAESAISIGQRIVAIDPRYYRPTEVETLLGNAAKAREVLNWLAKWCKATSRWRAVRLSLSVLVTA